VAERAIGGLMLTRIMDRLCAQRGHPQVIRTDNGKEFCGKAMLTWCHAHGVKLRLIEPGKPNQNAYIESLPCRLVPRWPPPPAGGAPAGRAAAAGGAAGGLAAAVRCARARSPFGPGSNGSSVAGTFCRLNTAVCEWM
jgi:hypothetical protein